MRCPERPRVVPLDGAPCRLHRSGRAWLARVAGGRGPCPRLRVPAKGLALQLLIVLAVVEYGTGEPGLLHVARTAVRLCGRDVGLDAVHRHARGARRRVRLAGCAHDERRHAAHRARGRGRPRARSARPERRRELPPGAVAVPATGGGHERRPGATGCQPSPHSRVPWPTPGVAPILYGRSTARVRAGATRR